MTKILIGSWNIGRINSPDHPFHRVFPVIVKTMIENEANGFCICLFEGKDNSEEVRAGIIKSLESALTPYPRLQKLERTVRWYLAGGRGATQEIYWVVCLGCTFQEQSLDPKLAAAFLGKLKSVIRSIATSWIQPHTVDLTAYSHLSLNTIQGGTAKPTSLMNIQTNEYRSSLRRERDEYMYRAKNLISNLEREGLILTQGGRNLTEWVETGRDTITDEELISKVEELVSSRFEDFFRYPLLGIVTWKSSGYFSGLSTAFLHAPGPDYMNLRAQGVFLSETSSSYLIRDAYFNLISFLPATLLAGDLNVYDIVDPRVWENVTEGFRTSRSGTGALDRIYLRNNQQLPASPIFQASLLLDPVEGRDKTIDHAGVMGLFTAMEMEMENWGEDNDDKEWQEQRVPNDGNCLFQAVAEAAGIFTAQELREQTVATDKPWSDQYRENVHTELIGTDTVEARIGRMALNKTWGGEPEIVALARITGRRIIVIQGGVVRSDTQAGALVNRRLTDAAVIDLSDIAIFLSYNGATHYNWLSYG